MCVQKPPKKGLGQKKHFFIFFNANEIKFALGPVIFYMNYIYLLHYLYNGLFFFCCCSAGT